MVEVALVEALWLTLGGVLGVNNALNPDQFFLWDTVNVAAQVNAVLRARLAIVPVPELSALLDRGQVWRAIVRDNAKACVLST